MIAIEAGNEECFSVYWEAKKLCYQAVNKLTSRKDLPKAIEAATPYLLLSFDLIVTDEENIPTAPWQVVRDGISVAVLVSEAAMQFFKAMDVQKSTSSIKEDLKIIDKAHNIDFEKEDLSDLAHEAIAASQRVLNFVHNTINPCIIL